MYRRSRLLSCLICDSKVRQRLLDVIPLHQRRHDAASLALAIADRVDLHSGDDQMLYGSTTDNAKSVVNASKLILTDYEDLVTRARANRTQ